MSENKKPITTKQKSSNVMPPKRIKPAQSRSDMFFKFTKRFFTQFGTAIISVSIVAYVFLQLMLNVGAFLETEPAAYASISERAELDAYSKFYEKYRNSAASEVSGAVNNAVLIINGTEGTKSYGMVVDLAVAYYKDNR